MHSIFEFSILDILYWLSTIEITQFPRIEIFDLLPAGTFAWQLDYGSKSQIGQ